MSRALHYLRVESERLAREIAAIEKRVEDLEQDPSVSFADGHLDPRYKRLIDRSEMLSTNLCEIRVKVADFVAGKKEEKPEPLATSAADEKLKGPHCSHLDFVVTKLSQTFSYRQSQHHSKSFWF